MTDESSIQEDPVPADYVLLGDEEGRRGRRLFQTALALLIALLGYLAYTAKVSDVLHLYLGLTIVTLAAIPSLLWAKSGGSRFPVFEPVMLLCANTYALPLLNGRQQLAAYVPEVITQAGIAVVLYQIAAIGSYQLVRGKPGSSRFWTESILHRSIERFIVYGLILSCAYVAVSTFTTWIPADLSSILRAVFFGVGILCTFIASQQLGRGELNQTERFILIFTLAAQMVLQSVSLLLVNTISLLGIALLGYLSGSKKIPWAVLLVSFGCIAVLHNGKDPMRTKYWTENTPPPSVTEIPAFYQEWIEHGVTIRLDDEESNEGKSASRRLFERTSLMHILCLVADWSPDRQDYLHGETYGYVLPQLIPRFLWPEKPRSHVATYRLSIYYGLQDEDATNNTTIAFGMLAEAYANFGMIGAILLGLFWGVSLKKLQVLSGCSPMFSQAGLLMILLTAWAFAIELTMAVWISSLFQAAIFVIGVPLLIRGFFSD